MIPRLLLLLLLLLIQGVTSQEDETTSYEITSFECNRNHQEVSSSQKSAGDEIRICFSLSQETIDRGVTINRFENVAFTKGKSQSFQAVEDSVAADGGLTQIECTSGDTTCAISTLLPTSMFGSTGTVTISGGLSLQFGTLINGILVSSPINERYRIDHDIQVKGPKGNHPFKGASGGGGGDASAASGLISPGGMLPLVESTWQLLLPVLDHAGANSGEVARDGAYNNIESVSSTRSVP